MPLVPRRTGRTYSHLPKGRSAGGQTLRAGSPTSHKPWARLAPLAGFVWMVVWWMGGFSGGNFAGGLAVGALGMAGGVAVRYAAMRGEQKTVPMHYDAELTTPEIRRGQPVEVTVRITDPAQLGHWLGVGLICTESYDVRVRSDDSTRRVTRRDDVVEWWQPVDPARPEQRLSFATPADGPFSYEGDCLSYAWRVIAREQAEGRIDTYRELPVWVTP